MHSDSASKPPRPGAGKKITPPKPQPEKPKRREEPSWRNLIQLQSFPFEAVDSDEGFWTFQNVPPAVPPSVVMEIKRMLPEIAELLKRTPKDGTVTLPAKTLGFLTLWGSGLQLDLVRWVTIAAFMEQYREELQERMEKINSIKDDAARGRAFSAFLRDHE